MKKSLKILWLILGFLYCPVYFMCIVMHFVARIILAICYFGMFEKRMAIDILNNLFSSFLCSTSSLEYIFMNSELRASF
jgi:hypothetical protein